MQIRRAAAVLLSLSLLACGDDGGKPKLIDAGGGDSGPRACVSTVSIGTLDFSTENKTSKYISWYAPSAGTFSDMEPLFITFEFYPDMAMTPIGPGAIDLASGENADYATCRVCILAFPQDGNVQKTYFQRAGTVTLTEDPLNTRNFKATITGLVLEEVNIDSQTFESTPIPTGSCANIPDKTVDEDRVPNAWTCATADWDNTTACDCQCGANDPDCYLPGKTVNNCSVGGQACFNDGCVARPANDTCATAEVLAVGATGATGTTIGADHNYDMGLEGMTCTGFRQRGGDVVYRVNGLTANQAYNISLTGTWDTPDAEYDPSFAVLGPLPGTTPEAICNATPITTCLAGADATEYMDETKTFTPTMAGDYYIIVDGYYSNEGGAFTLTIQ